MIRVPVLVFKEDDGSYSAESLGLDCDAGEGATKDAALADLKNNLKEFLEDCDGELTDVFV